MIVRGPEIMADAVALKPVEATQCAADDVTISGGDRRTETPMTR